MARANAWPPSETLHLWAQETRQAIFQCQVGQLGSFGESCCKMHPGWTQHFLKESQAVPSKKALDTRTAWMTSDSACQVLCPTSLKSHQWKTMPTNNRHQEENQKWIVQWPRPRPCWPRLCLCKVESPKATVASSMAWWMKFSWYQITFPHKNKNVQWG